MLIQLINSGLRKIPTWVLYILLPIPGILAIVAGLTDNLGPEPIKELEGELGEVAIKLLIIGLAVTPLLHFTRINLLRFRRAIGVVAFGYVAAHFLTWLLLDVQLLSQIWADILKRPYISVGFVGFMAMVPLAVTSNNWSMRKLGQFWSVLHRLTYIATILGGLHYIMLVKGFQMEPLVHMAIILAFLALRVPKWRRSVQASLRGLPDKVLRR
jgi:sulfoxide reductase heme-binding subunit YedZ|tara:strand:- start:81 stop:719 length:639 start_codon:yes stop_codon:yes gene_type:complete